VEVGYIKINAVHDLLDDRPCITERPEQNNLRRKAQGIIEGIRQVVELFDECQFARRRHGYLQRQNEIDLMSAHREIRQSEFFPKKLTDFQKKTVPKRAYPKEQKSDRRNSLATNLLF